MIRVQFFSLKRIINTLLEDFTNRDKMEEEEGILDQERTTQES